MWSVFSDLFTPGFLSGGVIISIRFYRKFFFGFVWKWIAGVFLRFLSFPANVFIVYFIVLIFCFNDKIITSYFLLKNPPRVSVGVF